MKKYEEYEKKLNDYGVAVNWFKNREKNDSQTGKLYSLYNVIFSAEYCGQAHAGAPNYHPSPKNLNEAVSNVIREDFVNIIEKALKNIKNDCRKILIESEKELLEELENIKDTKNILEDNKGNTL